MSDTLIDPTFELVQSRLSSGEYVPGSCSDGRKLGIALGSGGLAGINALGKLSVMEESGIFDVVDLWEGDSIGGINAGICVAGQIEEARDTYYTLRRRGLIDVWRAIRIGGRAIDMSILRDAMEPILDTEKIAESPVPVNVGITKLKPFSRLSVDLSKEAPEHILPWMMRGGHLPIVGGSAPRDAYGMPYADPGLSSLGPVHRAVQNGCTDVIYISCQPYAPDKKHPWQVGLVGAWGMRHDPLAILKYNKVVNDQISGRRVFRQGSFMYNGAHVYGFYPPMPQNKSEAWPTLYTTDPGLLKSGFERCADYMRHCLQKLLPEYIPAS
jgi:hypothetical protein